MSSVAGATEVAYMPVFCRVLKALRCNTPEDKESFIDEGPPKLLPTPLIHMISEYVVLKFSPQNSAAAPAAPCVAPVPAPAHDPTSAVGARRVTYIQVFCRVTTALRCNTPEDEEPPILPIALARIISGYVVAQNLPQKGKCPRPPQVCIFNVDPEEAPIDFNIVCLEVQQTVEELERTKENLVIVSQSGQKPLSIQIPAPDDDVPPISTPKPEASTPTPPPQQ